MTCRPWRGPPIGRLPAPAAVAELVDAHGSGPCGGNSVEVRLLSAASQRARRRYSRQPACLGRLTRRRPAIGASRRRGDLLDEIGPEIAGEVVAHALEDAQAGVADRA